jgi:hypothetical protein
MNVRQIQGNLGDLKLMSPQEHKQMQISARQNAQQNAEKPNKSSNRNILQRNTDRFKKWYHGSQGVEGVALTSTDIKKFNKATGYKQGFKNRIRERVSKSEENQNERYAKNIQQDSMGRKTYSSVPTILGHKIRRISQNTSNKMLNRVSGVFLGGRRTRRTRHRQTHRTKRRTRSYKKRTNSRTKRRTRSYKKRTNSRTKRRTRSHKKRTNSRTKRRTRSHKRRTNSRTKRRTHRK